MSAAVDKRAVGYVSPATGVRWVPVIGLEVHVQLKTRT